MSNNLVKIENTNLTASKHYLRHLNNLLPHLHFKYLIPYRKKKKWGFCDENKNIIIPCIYDDVLYFKRGFARVYLKGKQTLINVHGAAALPSNYTYNGDWYFSYNYFVMYNDDNTSVVIDSDFNEILPAKYQYRLISNSEGLFMFHENKDSSCGIINRDGEVVVPCAYDYISKLTDHYFRVEKYKMMGIINKAGEEVYPCIFDKIDFPQSGFSKISITKGSKPSIFIIKKTGEIITSKYDELIACPEKEERIIVVKDGKYGCINFDGVEIVACKYKSLGQFSEGMAPFLSTTNKHGYMDAFGNEKFNLTYNGWIGKGAFKEHFASVGVNGKYGFINQYGHEVIPFRYEGVKGFKNGLAGIKMNNKWGFLDKLGNQITEFKYSEIVSPAQYSDNESLWLVNFKRKWGAINQAGVEVIPCNYTEIYRFIGELCAVRIGRKWGILNSAGAEIVPCIFKDRPIIIRNSENLPSPLIRTDLGYIDINGSQYWQD